MSKKNKIVDEPQMNAPTEEGANSGSGEATPNPIPGMMKTFTGTKTLKAVEMTKKAYCAYRSWDVPVDENPNEVVYLVEYAADPLSQPNHPDHEGYISMSPKHVFDEAYAPSETFLDRLHIEKNNLDVKIVVLTSALENKKVPAKEVTILQLQLGTMQHYSKILETRINSAS